MGRSSPSSVAGERAPHRGAVSRTPPGRRRASDTRRRRSSRSNGFESHSVRPSAAARRAGSTAIGGDELDLRAEELPEPRLEPLDIVERFQANVRLVETVEQPTQPVGVLVDVVHRLDLVLDQRGPAPFREIAAELLRVLARGLRSPLRAIPEHHASNGDGGIGTANAVKTRSKPSVGTLLTEPDPRLRYARSGLRPNLGRGIRSRGSHVGAGGRPVLDAAVRRPPV